jgi:hypothetical protein
MSERIRMNEADRRALREACATIQKFTDRRFPHAPHIKEPVGLLLRQISGLVSGDIYHGEPVAGPIRMYDRVEWSAAAAGAQLDEAYTLMAEHYARQHEHVWAVCRSRVTALMYDTPVGSGVDYYRPTALSIACSVHGVPAGTPCNPRAGETAHGVTQK